MKEGAMFRTVAPGGPLGESVASIWLHESSALGQGTELRLPTGTVELVFNLSEDCSWSYPDAIAAGPYQHSYVLDTAQQSHVAGVVFRPGRALVDVPLHELANRHVALEDLWGADATRVRERMLAASDAATRLRVLESALHDRLADSTQDAHPLAAAATTWLSRVPECSAVGELSDRLGLTARRLQQVFRAEVGLSPKAYQRLQRFRSVLAGIDEVARVGWPAFALARGYYDQAHLAREFRVHSGLSPTAYLRGRGEQVNHVPR
jgi:AraC-like DNA-binding protein